VTKFQLIPYSQVKLWIANYMQLRLLFADPVSNDVFHSRTVEIFHQICYYWCPGILSNDCPQSKIPHSLFVTLYRLAADPVITISKLHVAKISYALIYPVLLNQQAIFSNVKPHSFTCPESFMH